MDRNLVRSLILVLAWTIVVSVGAVVAKADIGEGQIRVLVITGGHAFEKEPFFALFDGIPDISYTKSEYPAAAELLKPELASSCDVIVFYDMWAKGITADQQAAFLNLLQSGIGIVALHHTLAAHDNWPEYAKIVGGRYYRKAETQNGKTIPASSFFHGQDLDVKVVDAEHPITRGLKAFQIHDETYQDYTTNPDVRVLLTTDHPNSDPELAWVHTYKNSRVFYLLLGHDHVAYENPAYRTLVARGIRWAAGRLTVVSGR